MNNVKQQNRPRGISQNFLKEVTEKLTMLSTLSKDSGVEIPNELEETLKELSISSSKRLPELESSESSLISEAQNDSFIELPAPSDTSRMDSSVESSSVKQLKCNSDMLCKAVKEKLQEFRSLNKQSRNNGVKATIELKNYQHELRDMKSSVIEIIDEANSTKEQIIKMKEKLESEINDKMGLDVRDRIEEAKEISELDNRDPDSVGYEEYDMSLYKGGPPDCSGMLIEQIKELHQEIYKIQSRIEKSEQDLIIKEMENKELRSIIENLNESFEKIETLHDDSAASCQHCRVF